MRLLVVSTILEAFQFTWLKRVRLAQVIALPSLALILIGIYWLYAGRLTGTYGSIHWALFVLQTLAFTPFAVACHRVLLLGEKSLPRYGIMGWKKREFHFCIWLLIAILVGSFVMISTMMILGGIVANVFTFPKEDWQGWLGWILMTACQLLASYFAARLCLILPSIALEQKFRISEIWQLSHGNGWRLTAVLAGFPWLLHYLQGLAFPEEIPLSWQFWAAHCIAYSSWLKWPRCLFHTKRYPFKDKGVRNHFAARGGNLVYLVDPFI